MKENYRRQLNLLLDTLPFVLEDNRFALKGGTAINLFYQHFPRLSVDIDLCYLPIEDRRTTLNNIHQILLNIKKKLEGMGLKVKSSKPLDGKQEVKLSVYGKETEIKIEPNFILRGNLFDVEMKEITEVIQHDFGKDVEVQCLGFADVYGGKICAALDRQHPRDIFDIMILMDHGEISNDIKEAFIYHIISHNRPIHEVLDPNLKDMKDIFEKEFLGMANLEVKLSDLETTRECLVKDINNALNLKDKTFLISFMNNKPEWSLFHHEKIRNYPSVKWKILNQEKMDPRKKNKYVRNLEKILA